MDSLRKGHQAMVFVHSRKDTGKSGRMLVTKAQNGGEAATFDCSDQDAYPYLAKDVKRSRNKCAPARPGAPGAPFTPCARRLS